MEFYDFRFSWEWNKNPNWLSVHHFSEWFWYTTNQYIFDSICIFPEVSRWTWSVESSFGQIGAFSVRGNPIAAWEHGVAWRTCHWLWEHHYPSSIMFRHFPISFPWFTHHVVSFTMPISFPPHRNAYNDATDATREAQEAIEMLTHECPGFCLRCLFVFPIGNPPFRESIVNSFYFFWDPLGKSKCLVLLSSPSDLRKSRIWID